MVVAIMQTIMLIVVLANFDGDNDSDMKRQYNKKRDDDDNNDYDNFKKTMIHDNIR